MLLLLALVHQAGGDAARAKATLSQALLLAEPGGFIRIFVDEGRPMAHLLYEALSRGIAPDYVGRLLAAFPLAESEQTGQSETQTAKTELIEPLSEREIEVLQLIAEGLTNTEIASALFLSLNTVKAHTRNINGKLGVHSRMQAVARARASGYSVASEIRPSCCPLLSKLNVIFRPRRFPLRQTANQSHTLSQRNNPTTSRLTP